MKTTDKVLRSQCIKQEQTSQLQLAPYQALPVAGPIITHHRASALDVMEPSPDLSEEVGSWSSPTAVLPSCAPSDRVVPCRNAWPPWGRSSPST
jgi:hypothetical protein